MGNDVGLHLVDALLARSVSARPPTSLHEQRGHVYVCVLGLSTCSAAFGLNGALLTSVRAPAYCSDTNARAGASVGLPSCPGLVRILPIPALLSSEVVQSDVAAAACSPPTMFMATQLVFADM